MKTRVAVLAIIVEEAASVPQLNDLLHENSEHIIGRMGIPYRAKKINVMSVAVDAPQDVTAALTGKIGALPGIRVKTAYSQLERDE